jgi:excisionase family DNA binding protein
VSNRDTLISSIAAEVVRLIVPKLVELRPTVIQPALMTVRDAGIYLGRTEQAIQHMIFQRTLPVVRSGRRVHLRRSDLDAWIDGNTY